MGLNFSRISARRQLQYFFGKNSANLQIFLNDGRGVGGKEEVKIEEKAVTRAGMKGGSAFLNANLLKKRKLT